MTEPIYQVVMRDNQEMHFPRFVMSDGYEV